QTPQRPFRWPARSPAPHCPNRRPTCRSGRLSLPRRRKWPAPPKSRTPKAQPAGRPREESFSHAWFVSLSVLRSPQRARQYKIPVLWWIKLYGLSLGLGQLLSSAQKSVMHEVSWPALPDARAIRKTFRAVSHTGKATWLVAPAFEAKEMSLY